MTKSATPQRIQRRRTKGSRLPQSAVVVSRPTKWGNWFVVSPKLSAEKAVLLHRHLLLAAPTHLPGQWPAFRHLIRSTINELAGRDMACWCCLEDPCHGNTLLEMANSPEERWPVIEGINHAALLLRFQDGETIEELATRFEVMPESIEDVLRQYI